MHFQRQGAHFQQARRDDGPWQHASGPEVIAPDLRFDTGSAGGTWSFSGSIAAPGEYRFLIQIGHPHDMPQGVTPNRVVRITVGDGTPATPEISPAIELLDDRTVRVIVPSEQLDANRDSRYVVRYQAFGSWHRLMEFGYDGVRDAAMWGGGWREYVITSHHTLLPFAGDMAVEVVNVPGAFGSGWTGGTVVGATTVRPGAGAITPNRPSVGGPAVGARPVE